MPDGRAVAALKRLTPCLAIGLSSCWEWCTPWPEPPVPIVHSLAVSPNALEVYVSDPAKGASANFVGLAYDRYGRLIAGEAITFTIGTGAGATISALNSKGDTATFVIPPNTPATDRSLTVVATHAGTGLSVTVPVTVHSSRAAPNGVGADPTSNWPMVGLASGSQSPTWKRNLVQPFVRRAGFGDFDDIEPTPLGDIASGTVMSSAYALWRTTDPWKTASPDVVVPTNGTADRAKIPIRPFYAGNDISTAAAPFITDLQAGADILEHTLTGVIVTISTAEKTDKEFTWTDQCKDFGMWLAGVSQQPSADYLAIYMVKRSGTNGGDRGIQCGPKTLTDDATSPLYKLQAILLPEGTVSPATIAHEVAHALSLAHVSFGSGFYDDNLMVQVDDISAALRSRLTVGQAFRAALDPLSWLAASGQMKSLPVDCITTQWQCPLLALDILARVP
jgi:hypothetical protein